MYTETFLKSLPEGNTNCKICPHCKVALSPTFRREILNENLYGLRSLPTSVQTSDGLVSWNHYVGTCDKCGQQFLYLGCSVE